MEETKKRRYNRKPVTEITEENYMEFSAKDLFREIEKLRNMTQIGEYKQENSILKRKLTNIGKIIYGKDLSKK